MAEWSIAAVLKTVDLRGSGGSNPSLSAKANRMMQIIRFFYCPMPWHACMPEAVDNKKMMCRKAHLVCFKAPPRRAGEGMPTAGRPNPDAGGNGGAPIPALLGMAEPNPPPIGSIILPSQDDGTPNPSQISIQYISPVPPVKKTYEWHASTALGYL